MARRETLLLWVLLVYGEGIYDLLIVDAIWDSAETRKGMNMVGIISYRDSVVSYLALSHLIARHFVPQGQKDDLNYVWVGRRKCG